MILSLGKELLKAKQIKCFFLGKTNRNWRLKFLLPYILRLSPTVSKFLSGLTLKAPILEHNIQTENFTFYMLERPQMPQFSLVQLAEHLNTATAYVHVK